MKTMTYQKVGNFIVLLHGTVQPTDEEWNRYVAEYEYQSVLVVTEGGAPSATQRSVLLKRMDVFKAKGLRPPRGAIVTASTFVRGVMTALSWFYRDVYAAFAPERLDDAMMYLGVPRAQMLQVKSVIQALKKELHAGGSSSTPVRQ